MRDFKRQYGPWALITGASAGLGTEFARQLAGKGLNLALAARRRERLDELGERLAGEHGIQTRSVTVDLTEPDFMPRLRAELDDLEIGLLVNNAGFGQLGEFLDHSQESELGMLDLNCRAPLLLTHHFAGAMRDRGRGGIIMLSSMAGLIPNPYFSHYAATKAWNLFLGEGLAVELERYGVDVLNLCPGPTRTEFFEVADVDPGRWPKLAQGIVMSADKVVAAAVDGLGRRTTVVPGLHNRLMLGSSRFTPRGLAARVTGRMMKMAGGK